MVSFQKVRGKPKGKPTGGSGGAGGDVYVVADPGVSTLLRYRRHPHLSAGDGTHGRGDLQHGRRGKDLEVPVPLGTLVYDEDGVLLADLVAPGQRVKVLSGGRGGRGNAAFVTPRNRAPAVCEQGEYGPEAWFTFELKLLADAALVGFPNAGKSTLISRISAARPKIADYPFTTLEPHLGVVAADDREFVLADIPGLIEGAAEGRGLGHEFLRHVERARVLVFLLDPSPLQEHPPARQLEILRRELAAHAPELAERPHLVVVGKADLAGAAEAAAELEGALTVSSVTGEGLDEFVHRVADLVEQAERASPEREGYVLHRPAAEGFRVVREADGWRVEGGAARRAVALADLTTAEAADLVATRLRRLGVDRALAAAGVREGDLVRIGDLEFEWHPDDEGDVP